MKTKTILYQIDQFFFAPSSGKVMAFFRITIAIFCLLKFWSLYNDLLNIFGSQGFVKGDVAAILLADYMPRLSWFCDAIAKWGVEGNVLRCEFLHDGSPTSAALLKCDIKKTLLVATLTGVGGWKDTIQFRRSQFIEASLSEVKALVPSENTSAVPHKR